MTKRNLKAALEKNGGVKAYVNSDMYENMTDDQLKDAIFQARRNQDIDISLKMANDNRRNTLMRKAGFDYFDIDELQPHPDNQYSVDEESIKNLAGLIYKSKEIQPLVLQETENGIRIIDGERRWRACKYLTELYGDAWRMVPAHCHPLGSLSDEDAEFILHSNNFGQRRLTPSEVAMGFQVLADSLAEWRKDDPSLKGVKTKTYLAEHFGVSERTAMTNLSIAKGLTETGKELLDNGGINKTQAEAMSHLPEEKQEMIVEILQEQELDSSQISHLIETVKSTDVEPTEIGDIKKEAPAKKPKETNAYLKSARNALRRANRCPQEADLALLGQIKQLLRELDQKNS